MSRCAVGPQQPLAVEGNVHIAHEAKPGAKKLTGCYQKVSSKVINVWLLLSYLLWILLYEMTPWVSSATVVVNRPEPGIGATT